MRTHTEEMEEQRVTAKTPAKQGQTTTLRETNKKQTKTETIKDYTVRGTKVKKNQGITSSQFSQVQRFQRLQGNGRRV